MAHQVLMPKLSSTMETGKITEWFKKEGDVIKQGDPIFEVMTDKIAIEVEAYEEGILLKRYLEVDDEAPVNSVVAYIGKEGEKVPDTVQHVEQVIQEETPNEVTESETKESNVSKINEKVRATPSARKYAYQNNIDLTKIVGSGSRNRIHLEDVKNAKIDSFEKPCCKSSCETSNDVFVKWGGIRKQISDQMVKSKTTIPHVAMHARVDVDLLTSLKKDLSNISDKKHSVSITVTDLIVYICSRVLVKHKNLNAITSEEGYTVHNSVNIGLAVALEEGLIVPVIHNADKLSVSEIAIIRKDLVNKAKTNSLKPSELKGGTFTISSIGKGVIQGFTPVINHPQVAILGVGSTYSDLALVDGNLKSVDRLQLSLSFDHRVVDGYPASVFLEELVNAIEKPYTLFL